MLFRVLALATSVVATGAVLMSEHTPATASSGAVAFSAAQAAQGEKMYAQSCASCHGADLKGISAPALGGKTSGVAQQTVAQVYGYLSQQMPMTAPGSLKAAQYVSIMAYLLERNGHKPGAHPLTLAGATTSTAELYAGH